MGIAIQNDITGFMNWYIGEKVGNIKTGHPLVPRSLTSSSHILKPSG